MIYVDANYWIYWFDERLQEHKYVSKPMRSAINEGIMINYVTLMEIAHYLRNLDQAEFRDRMDTIQQLGTLMLVDLDARTTNTALEFLTKYAPLGIGGRDSIILATMQVTNVKKILTHDDAFKSVKGIKVIDSIPKL